MDLVSWLLQITFIDSAKKTFSKKFVVILHCDLCCSTIQETVEVEKQEKPASPV